MAGRTMRQHDCGQGLIGDSIMKALLIALVALTLLAGPTATLALDVQDFDPLDRQLF